MRKFNLSRNIDGQYPRTEKKNTTEDLKKYPVKLKTNVSTSISSVTDKAAT